MKNGGLSIFFLFLVANLFEAVRFSTDYTYEGGECTYQKLYRQSPDSYAYMVWIDCQVTILPLSDYNKMDALSKQKAKNVLGSPKKCVGFDYYVDMKFNESGPVVYIWDAFKQVSEILRIQYGVSTYNISSRLPRSYTYIPYFHSTDGFYNIMTSGYNHHAAKQSFLWYNETSAFCASINDDVQNEWFRMGLFNSKQSSQLALWYAAKGNVDEGRFSPIASVISGLVLLVVCLIMFIPLACLIIIMFNNKRKFRRLRRRIEAFLTTCFYQKIVDEKFIAEDYKLLMQKLKANRPEISVVGKRVPSRKTKFLPVDDTTKKPDIPATAFGGSVKFPIPTAAQLFTKTKKKPPKKGKSKHKTLTDEDLKSKDKLQPAQAKESVVPISSTAQSGTTTTVDDFVVAYNKDDAKSNIMHESGIHKTGQPFQLADEVSAIDYDSGASKPQTPNSTTASTAPSEVKKPTTSVDKKVKEQKPEKDGKKESKDTKKRKKMYPFDLSDTQKE